MFVTLFVGALDLSTGVLQYTNAGHNAPVIITDGKPSFLPVDANIPVGIVEDWSYSQQETTLSPDTLLFLYTDGSHPERRRTVPGGKSPGTTRRS